MQARIRTRTTSKHAVQFSVIFASYCLLIQSSFAFTHYSPSATTRVITSVRTRRSQFAHISKRLIINKTNEQPNPSHLFLSKPSEDTTTNAISRIQEKVSSGSPWQFTLFLSLAGAALGPFLDSYHSAFHVLQYDSPIEITLWGTTEHPALITSWWVPFLFGIAGCLIGWLYILYDAVFTVSTSRDDNIPSAVKILIGISCFTLQYWLSGILVASGVDRTTILNVMSVLAAAGFLALDQTFAGLIVSASTAIGGPFIEVGLLSLSRTGILGEYGYHYLDPGETGYFPLWIAPVYFLGGPAVGNLARGVWSALKAEKTVRAKTSGCMVCKDTRCVNCPNCDAMGRYQAIGGRVVTCTSCRGRGFVICRACFAWYDEDPNDIEAIREIMSKMPD